MHNNDVSRKVSKHAEQAKAYIMLKKFIIILPLPGQKDLSIVGNGATPWQWNFWFTIQVQYPSFCQGVKTSGMTFHKSTQIT